MQSGVLRLYLQSLAEHPSGSWHDETRRDLAYLVESGSGDALPHWNDLIRLFPRSRHAAEALYRVGLLSEAPQKPAEPIRAFETLVKEHPSSRWAGDAAVRLIDVRLEQEYDLPRATGLAEAAVAWLERAGDHEPVGPGLDAALGQTLPESRHLAAAFDAMQPSVISAAARKAIEALPTAEQTAYAIYVRAGLVEYLLERPEAAVAFFEKAKPLAPPPKRDAVVIGHVPTGIEQLIEVAKSGRSLTPDEARAGDRKAKLILMLADVHVAGREWTKAIGLCDKVIESKKFSATPHQRSWAYHQKASAIYGIPDCKNAYDDLLSAEKASPSAPWAAESLLFAGCIANNILKDDALALTQYQAVVARHPTSEVAPKAAFFVGVTHESNKEWDRAKAAYTLYLKKYPDAPWTNLVKNSHLPEVEREISEAHARSVRATTP
jgi:outer membrane protein assembly factor BamD (BamD/ComL family)